MIDYITIMRKIILFINSAVTQEKIDKFTTYNSDENNTYRVGTKFYKQSVIIK